jgi:HEPN domain-containing protein
MRIETKEWLKIAREEHRSALVLLKEGIYRMVCYHSQQAVEKVLKAMLSEHEIDFARTHNLIDLKNMAISAGYKIDLTDEEAMFLNSVYKSRYPAGFGLLPEGDPNNDDGETALRIADRVMEFARLSFPSAM